MATYNMKLTDTSIFSCCILILHHQTAFISINLHGAHNNINALSLRHRYEVGAGGKTAHFHIRCDKTAQFYKCAKTAHLQVC